MEESHQISDQNLLGEADICYILCETNFLVHEGNILTLTVLSTLQQKSPSTSQKGWEKYCIFLLLPKWEFVVFKKTYKWKLNLLFLGKTNRSPGHKVEHCSCELYAQKNTKSNGAKVWLLSTDVNLVWHWTVIIQIPRLHHSLIDMECLSKNGWWINHAKTYYR